MDRLNQSTILRGRPVTSSNAAHANEYFEHFLNASTLKTILGYYRNICDLLHLKPNVYPQFYPKLRANLTSWRAKALWKKFDARSSHKCYGKGKACPNTRVLIIGAGPCGLRTAIEAQLLGAKVVVVEKRDRMSRNNVLHLWPFVIEDLRALGAKKFFGKFCAGSIDHISIRQLQCILLKAALLLGVEVHTEVSFERLVEPNPAEKTGWRAECKPLNHPVSQYEFDVIIGADGKRNTLQGFKRKEFRGKLAIAITANFINKRTEAEAIVEEISGVAFIFNQKFFKDLYAETGIDLENIVYYKDDTHYFVMTAKKPSLIDKGVIKQDLADTERLLAPDNVNREALMNYAREAAEFSTNYQLPDLEFAVNHYGQPDVAMFDFTSMYAAENASKIVERHGYKLLMILVGDSLLEPFWPTGSGCARGFLSSLDAAWAIRSWGSGVTNPLEVLAERESIYRLLAQTTPDNLNKDWKAYTLDPATRYPNLNKNVVLPHQTLSLYDTDNPKNLERSRRNSQDLMLTKTELPRKRRREIDSEVLVNWIKEQIKEHEDLAVTDISSVFKDGRILCAIINRYRPDLLDYSAINRDEPATNNQIAFDVLEKELGIVPVMTGEEMTKTDDYLTMASYLTQVYDTFRCEIPHIKHPKLELPESKRYETNFSKFHYTPSKSVTPQSLQPPVRPSSRHKRHADAMTQNKPAVVPDRKARKRRTLEKVGASVEERQKCLEDIIANRNDRQSKRRQQRKLQTENFIKSMQMLQANAKPDHSEPFEDYSIFLYRQTAPNFEDRVKDLERKFTYIPDREAKLPAQSRGEKDEDFVARIKGLEDKWKEPVHTEKKPKDLLRAIGKIETSDWNIKEIEKKIMENKMGKTVNKDKEKVPKWSREQFLARQTKMEKQHLDRQDSAEAKYAVIDKSIKQLEQKLKEGTARDLGQNKVATITEKFVSKTTTENEPKPLQKSDSKVILPAQGGSEYCHFCNKRVYLMERLSAEGRFFHHGCFRCQYCNTQLRLGSYSFDRDGQFGHKFFCVHHYGMQGELYNNKVTRKVSQRLAKSPDKKPYGAVTGLDLLDRVQTPERIEFSNLNENASSDHEESPSQMDEDEWTDRNFGASTAELGSSDDESSSLSETDSDDEDAYEEALEEPVTKEGTLKWAERWKQRYLRRRNDSGSDGYSSSDRSSYYENSSEGDDDSETATEGEEEIRARELRKQEVRVEPPVVHTDTGTDTEVKSPSDLTINPEITQIELPDILPNNENNQLSPNANLNKSSDSISVNSGEFNSAESGSDTGNIPKGNSLEEKKPNLLAKSATVGSMNQIKRNFVLPPKEQRKSFGKEFVPLFKPAEPEPLLIIKRTPSKLNIPPEIGKPKVALKTDISNARKYFGTTVSKPKMPQPKSVFKKPEVLPKKIIKQTSLPESNLNDTVGKTGNEQNDNENRKDSVISFNFEPEDADLKEVDSYIENLIQNEKELLKPIDPNRYKTKTDDTDDEKVSSSIEDLLKALETETAPASTDAIKSTDEKLEDLLNWMDDLDHQPNERKVYRSFSAAKYKNLERTLKTPKRAATIVSKIPKDNIIYFEKHLAGKSVDLEDEPCSKNFGLCRSKTDVACNRGRGSVDLDAISNVDIKKVLMKFESKNNSENDGSLKTVPKRRSFSSFKFNGSEDNSDEDTKSDVRTQNDGTTKELSDILKDINDFVKETKSCDGDDSKGSENFSFTDSNKNTEISSEFDNVTGDVNLENMNTPNNVESEILKSSNLEETKCGAEKSENVTAENAAHDKNSEVELTSNETFNVVDFSVDDEKEFQPIVPLNIEALYAKVDKSKKTEKKAETYSPPIPRRSKRLNLSPEKLPDVTLTGPPQRPMRQKSLESKKPSADNLQPVAPQRKRSTTVSPHLQRKNDPKTAPQKEVVAIRNLPKVQHANFKQVDVKEPEPKTDRKYKNPKDKDCCIQ